MQKEDIHILVVDDDATLGKVIRETFVRAGFKSQHVQKPDEALSLLKLQPFHAAIIDCMLPKMNGRQLAKKIREELGPDFPIALMSGIYKDKGFAREAMAESNAIGFLSKPFNIEDLLKLIEAKLEPLIDVQLAPLQTLLTKESASHKERIKIINDAGEVHGYDLPWVFSVLMHPRINGHLNIISADGEVCGVGFQKGNIVQVNQKDSKSYFGILMVENGFISQQDLDETMKQAGKTKKVGERLVEANVLSPHAISIVMAEQQGIRLSKTIAETSVKINFIESDELREDAFTDRSAFIEILNEWMLSKISLDWLKSYYMPWARYNVKVGPEFEAQHLLFSMPVFKRTPKILDLLVEKASLEQALMDTTYPEAHFYASLHALVVTRVIRFGEVTATQGDYAAQKKRLTRIFTDLEKQNFFERLGVSPKAKDAEIKRTYHDLAKILHPDKVPVDAPDEIRDLTKKCFGFISAAYETLSDPAKKAEYILELEKGRADSILEAEQLTQNARQLLKKGDYKKARDTMTEVVALCPPTTEARLLFMWSKLKAASKDQTSTIVEQIKEELGQIPPEDRHNPIYYFVKGLQLKLSGDAEGAKKNLAHSVSLDPEFIDAKREMMAAGPSEDAKPVNMLNADLKDVVGMLFKKKR